MSDRIERACTKCGSFLHHEDDCASGSLAAHGSPRCLTCKHGEEHYTHLTGCVACKYPSERAPHIIDAIVLRLGRWCVPNCIAARCPHYAENGLHERPGATTQKDTHAK